MAEHEGGAPQPAEIQEKAKAPEMERVSKERVGLTTRLLLSREALDPTKTDLPDITNNHITAERFNQSTTSLIRLSDQERDEYWTRQPENDFDNQKQAWVRQVKETLTKKTTLGSEADKSAWNEFYKKLGFEGDITDEKLHDYYNHYFTGENKSKSVVLFAANILKAYKSGEDIDSDKLRADMDKITWFSNIFGSNTSKILPSLIEASGFFHDIPTMRELVEKANTKENGISRVNRLTDEEKRLLALLHSQESKSTVQPTPKEPQKEKTEGNTKDETEPKERKPAIVIPKEQLDALKKKKIKLGEDEEEITYEQLVDKVIDLQTGKVKDSLPKLKPEFDALIQAVANLTPEAKNDLDKSRALILSSSTWAMLDSIAQRSNDTKKMLSFNLMTIRPDREKKNITVAASLAPSADYSKAEEKNALSSDITFPQENLNKLCQSLGVKKLETISIHTHPAALGEKFISTPSDEDMARATQMVEENTRHTWGILTKTPDGNLNIVVYSSYKKPDGSIIHPQMGILSVDGSALHPPADSRSQREPKKAA